MVAKDITAYYSWLNTRGFLWSSDSNRLVFGNSGGTEVRITGPAGTDSFPIEAPLLSGPYWTEDNRLVFEVGGQTPELIIADPSGAVIARLDNSAWPYPTADGIFTTIVEAVEEESMYDYYYTGFAHVEGDGANFRPVLATHADSCLFAWPRGEENRETKYFAVSDAGDLFLQRYAGPGPKRIDLLSQDIFLTYSEFSYPFWFSISPDGNSLVALPLTLTEYGEFGEQAGYWDLVYLDRQGNSELIAAKIYDVKEMGLPIPFGNQPFTIAPAGNTIYFIKDGNHSYDLWQVSLAEKAPFLFLEQSGLPEFRP